MVVLVVATTSDPASIGPAAAFLAMPGWSPGPPIAVRTKQSFCLNPIYKSRFGPSTRVLRYLLFYSNSYASTTNIICGVARTLGATLAAQNPVGFPVVSPGQENAGQAPLGQFLVPFGSPRNAELQPQSLRFPWGRKP